MALLESHLSLRHRDRVPADLNVALVDLYMQQTAAAHLGALFTDPF